MLTSCTLRTKSLPKQISKHVLHVGTVSRQSTSRSDGSVSVCHASFDLKTLVASGEEQTT